MSAFYFPFRSTVEEELKELDFSMASGTRTIEDISRNVEQLAQLHENLEGGREELDEVRYITLEGERHDQGEVYKRRGGRDELDEVRYTNLDGGRRVGGISRSR